METDLIMETLKTLGSSVTYDLLKSGAKQIYSNFNIEKLTKPNKKNNVASRSTR